MKLLFDANLSRRLVGQVLDLFPDSAQVSIIGDAPDDVQIWRHAEANGMAVVTKASDFYRMSVTWGAPPKVVWLRIGNAGSDAIVALLRTNARAIDAFGSDPSSALLILGATDDL